MFFLQKILIQIAHDQLTTHAFVILENLVYGHSLLLITLTSQTRSELTFYGFKLCNVYQSPTKSDRARELQCLKRPH